MRHGLRLVPGAAAALGLWLTPAVAAPNEKKNCGLVLEHYQESGKAAEFKIALRCDGDQKEAFPVNHPLVIGLTATTSSARNSDRVEIEHDFPLQNAVVAPDTTVMSLTYRAQLSDISGKTHIYAMAWPRSFVQDCTGGRSGCARYGYALARPASTNSTCLKKDEGGEMVVIDDLLCKGSADYRFKFR